MRDLLAKFDSTFGLDGDSGWALRLDRAAVLFAMLMVAFAPHSIAATQSAWLIGMSIYIVRLLIFPREFRGISRLDIALFSLTAWSVVSAAFSYAPDISLGRLKPTLLFLIAYLVAGCVRTKAAALVFAGALIFSCMINVVLVPFERLIGRGVEVHGVDPAGALSRADIKEGDTILSAGKRKISSPEELVDEILRDGAVELRVYKTDWEIKTTLRREDLALRDTPEEMLGFTTWKRSRNWRSAGFYGHFTTYGEVLQLIMSLTLGLGVAGFAVWRQQRTRPQVQTALIVIGACFALMALALVLNVTRAPQAGLLVSGILIVLLGLGRKWILIAALIILPIAAAALFALQQTREVGFIDAKDGSTAWRQVVWREGVNLWTSSTRNFVLGVGMDSIKRHAKEWRLFDNGRLPMGHFHSTPLQLAVERGLPALLIWLVIVGIYGRTLLKAIARSRTDDWRVRGIYLGCFGGLVGFLVSGLVHSNLGDGEVAMVFYILMGLALSLIALRGSEDRRTRSSSAGTS
jgi:hypothetical protein